MNPLQPSPLAEVITAYLLASGFHRRTADNGVEYWGHPSLGEGRSFDQVVHWAIGCESAGRDLRKEAADYRASLAS